MKQKISSEILTAAKKCLDLNIPFALFAYPDKKDYHFFADPTPDSEKEYQFVPALNAPESEGFFINMFETSTKVHPTVIEPVMTAREVIDSELPAMPGAMIHPSGESTPRELYDAQIVTVTNLLKTKHDKCVISRVIDMVEKDNPIDVAARYFSKCPTCFRFVYYTRDTGLWLGATPELLAEVDVLKGEIHTVALAGTRMAGSTGEWDEKNLLEHDIVTEHIVDVLRGQALDVQVEGYSNVPFGSVEHLCNKITAFGDVVPDELLSRLAPTPAVCGYPVDVAHGMIDMLEQHSRHCYGGWVGMKESSRASFYVNLRSAFAEKQPDGTYRYNLFAGGGITKKSAPQTEWSEAQAKIEPLLTAIHTEKSKKNRNETHI